MFAANITRAEAQQRSGEVRAESYDVRVDLTGRDGDGAPLASPETTFHSHTVLRFTGLADADTSVNLIADAVVSASLDGVALAADAFDGEHLALHVTPGEHTLEVSAIMRYSRTGEGLHRFVDPADGRVYLCLLYTSPSPRD